MHGRACKQYIFRSYNNSHSMLCVLMKILSHASEKKKTQILKGFGFPAFLLAVFKWYRGSEGVKCENSLRNPGMFKFTKNMIHKWQQSARRFLGEPVGHVSSSTKRGSWRTTTAHRTRQAEKQLQLAHLLSSSAKIEQRGVCDVRCRYSGDRRHLRHLARMRWRRPTPNKRAILWQEIPSHAAKRSSQKTRNWLEMCTCSPHSMLS